MSALNTQTAPLPTPKMNASGEPSADNYSPPEVTQVRPSYQPRSQANTTQVTNGDLDGQNVAATEAVKATTGLAQVVEKLNRDVQANTANAQLIADPAIRAYIDAKARGLKVRLVSDEDFQRATQQATQQVQQQQAATQPFVAPPNIEAMTNADLVKYLAETLNPQKVVKEALDAGLGNVITTLRQEFDNRLNQAVAPFQQDVQQRQVQGIHQQVALAKEKFSDYDQMVPLMKEVNATVQGATVEDLYWIAKARAGTPPISQREIETERPDVGSSLGSQRSPNGQRPQNQVYGNKRQDFNQMVRDAL